MTKISAMKVMSTICLSLLLFSCFNNNVETDQLNHRITSLEQKVDSLIRNANPVGLNNVNNSDTTSYSILNQAARCQAITKKGTQCKRKAKNKGYCWQHGG